MSQFDRRRFLYATGGLAGLVATSRLQALAQTETPSFPSNPFTLGRGIRRSAADSVVLWTRLAPEPLAADGHGGIDPVRVPVRWVVAADDGMRHVVQRGITFADPDFAHSVHVDVDRLSPGRWYWYQFNVRRRMEPGRPHADDACPPGSRRDGSASRSPRASISRWASTPPTSTWPPRISTWCCSSATTSMRTACRRRCRASTTAPSR